MKLPTALLYPIALMTFHVVPSASVTFCCPIPKRCVFWGDLCFKVDAPCGDGWQAGPFDCCGLGRCNIFCCNCDDVGGGNYCRGGPFYYLKTLPETSHPHKTNDDDDDNSGSHCGDIRAADALVFKEVDQNHDGKMSLEEYLDHVMLAYMDESYVLDTEPLIAKFHLYDANRDGFLEVDEMRLKE